MNSDETSPLLNKLNGEKKGDILTYPPAHKVQGRALILLFDGTGDSEDQDISNVVALKRMLHPIDDPKKQMIFYQTGIGTYHPDFPGLRDKKIPVISTASRTVDSAVAWSLGSHVQEAYKWIMDKYEDGDRICMFGFSRGAYTARAVGGMINKIGLLPKSREDQVERAYESYKQKGKDYKKEWQAFREINGSRDVPIEFLGVWDTVSSVGVVYGKTLPFADRNGSVKTFRHAVALDEHRARFRQDMWRLPKFSEHNKKPWSWSTDADQVWFAGAHCDVGGGSVINGTRPNLAHIALRWMIREIFKKEAGILFDPAELRAIGLDPDALYPVVKTRPPALEPTSDMTLSSSNTIKQPNAIVRFGSWVKSFFVTPPKEEKPDYSIYGSYSEEQLDLVDALAPIFDQLALKTAKWALLEIVPMKIRGYTPNLGKGRVIPPPFDPRAPGSTDDMKKKAEKDPRWTKVRVHRTVKTRMSCKTADGKERYVPRATVNGEIGLDKLNPDLIEWVD
ncbi:hypothetical protein JR316_0009222 [Psilocybe cubensis]|uniref:Uncharacterized protein n=2 Tax=Psilocybe cubensis TaxID=181762 RepID=A0ACB8GSX1_PSICU|nr:hypothetical protein JR316_0009222 [Psilocybe cubensis]KAH9478761.1 hypothetical protein JR316_0009222 [Psilocybe cubensis]